MSHGAIKRLPTVVGCEYVGEFCAFFGIWQCTEGVCDGLFRELNVFDLLMGFFVLLLVWMDGWMDGWREFWPLGFFSLSLSLAVGWLLWWIAGV